jgi:hypothetical protein
VARVGMPSYNCNKVTKINLRNIWWIVKNLYIWLLFNQNTNTMKKETAQLLAVLVVACYLIGQLQDIYSK